MQQVAKYKWSLYLDLWLTAGWLVNLAFNEAFHSFLLANLGLRTACASRFRSNLFGLAGRPLLILRQNSACLPWACAPPPTVNSSPWSVSTNNSMKAPIGSRLRSRLPFRRIFSPFRYSIRVRCWDLWAINSENRNKLKKIRRTYWRKKSSMTVMYQRVTNINRITIFDNLLL
jgi:hypothetical protein